MNGGHHSLKDNEIRITIRYNTMDTEIRSEILTFDLATFIGTAGGSLGLFLGFTLTGFAEQVLNYFMRNWFIFLIESTIIKLPTYVVLRSFKELINWLHYNNNCVCIWKSFRRGGQNFLNAIFWAVSFLLVDTNLQKKIYKIIIALYLPINHVLINYLNMSLTM